MVYKSGLTFFLTAKDKKLVCTLYKSVQHCSIFFSKFLTFVLDELHPSFLHVNRSEFFKEFNGDGPRHVTRVRHVSDTFFFISVQFSVTFDHTELHPSVLHVNRSEFCKEFNGDGPRYRTRVCQVTDTFFSFRYSSL